MNLVLQLTQQTESCAVFSVTDLGEQQHIIVACCRKTGQLKQRAFGEWVDLDNPQLQTLIQQTIGLAPVTTHHIINMLSQCNHPAVVATIQKLVDQLPVAQQAALNAIAQRRLLEVSGMTFEELSA